MSDDNDEGDGRSGDVSDDNDNGVLLVLTLKCHQDGIWIHRLVEALEGNRSRLRCRWRRNNDSEDDKQDKEDSNNYNDIEIQVVSVEDLLSEPFLVADWFSSSSSSFLYNNKLKTGVDLQRQHQQGQRLGKRIVGLVNRVSDAASPLSFKACIGILSSAEQRKIPVFNGSNSYALSCNKWCHHVLFHQAKLQSPITVAYYNSNSTEDDSPTLTTATITPTNTIMQAKKSKFEQATEMIIRQQQEQQEEGQELQQQEEEEGHTSTACESTKKRKLDDEREKKKDSDFLIKPNAGGFGEGIIRVSTRNNDATTAADATALPQHPKYSDNMSLVQEYIAPYSQRLYRIWYLCGKVQCAVERRLNVDTDKPDEEFTTACAGGGGSCSIRPKSKKKKDNKQKPLPQDSIFQQFLAWKIPQDVVSEIEQNLLPTLPSDAHCGSVEFLIDPSSRQRLYFDWNLLSTLPINVEEESRKSVWSESYNPWDELAIAIWKFVLPR